MILVRLMMYKLHSSKHLIKVHACRRITLMFVYNRITHPLRIPYYLLKRLRILIFDPSESILPTTTCWWWVFQCQFTIEKNQQIVGGTVFPSATSDHNIIGVRAAPLTNIPVA